VRPCLIVVGIRPSLPMSLHELKTGLSVAPMRELEPLIEEHAQVRRALDALEGAGTRAQRVVTTAPKRRRSAKTGTATRGPKQTATTTRGPGRPRGTGGRAQEALKLGPRIQHGVVRVATPYTHTSIAP
jgi:hypothetical protein